MKVDSASAPRQRRTARVLLLDQGGRLLLMKGRLPGAPRGAGGWFTIGGGIEPGETPRQAAAREILEETGFTDVELGGHAWTSTLALRDAEGPLLVTEHVFLARCAGGEPSRDGWRPIERELIDDIRWWDMADPRLRHERVFPPDLAERVAAALARPASGGGETGEPPR